MDLSSREGSQRICACLRQGGGESQAAEKTKCSNYLAWGRQGRSSLQWWGHCDLLLEGLPKEIVTQEKVFHRVDIPDPRKEEENCFWSRALLSLAAKAEMAMGIQAQWLD